LAPSNRVRLCFGFQFFKPYAIHAIALERSFGDLSWPSSSKNWTCRVNFFGLVFLSLTCKGLLIAADWLIQNCRAERGR